MPCWYFERKEIRDSPSLKQGIDQENENRYRREGARLILDAGTKLGLYPLKLEHLYSLQFAVTIKYGHMLKYIFVLRITAYFMSFDITFTSIDAGDVRSHSMLCTSNALCYC